MIAGSIDQLDALQPGIAVADLEKDLGKLESSVVLFSILFVDFACPSDPNALKMIQTIPFTI